MEHDFSLPRSSAPLRRRNHRAPRGALLILALLMTAATVGAQEPREQGEAALREAKELIYRQAVVGTELEALLRDAEEAFETAPPSSRRAYNLGRVYLLRGTYHNTVESKRPAISALEEALDYAENAIEKESFSEGYRLLADAHSQMMFSRGILYMARHGGTARDAALKALELDPKNPRAHISVAGFYLNAPPVAGGDPRRGIELLERGVELSRTDRSDRFLMYLWLSDAYEKQGDLDRARSYREQAARIYPDSPLVVGRPD